MHWVTDKQHFEKLKEEHDFLVLFFYGGFSDPAQRALRELEEFSAENEDVPVYGVDVQKVKGLHRQFGVETVPIALVLKDGKVAQSLEGVKSARFYAVALAGAGTSGARGRSGKRPRRVVVYSGPGCPACSQLKSYLRRQGIAFREVDIARDERAARELARRSRQMVVPQTDIDGHLVVGFDKPKLDGFLGIQTERSEP